MEKVETYPKLREKILEKFETYGDFAEALGVARVTVSYKLNKRVKFKRSDVLHWASILCIKKRDIPIFFEKGV